MSPLSLIVQTGRAKMGLKGARAAEWLTAQGVAVPPTANTAWLLGADPAHALLVSRLGASEFFLEEDSAGQILERISIALRAPQPQVYPVLREDAAFMLSGPGVHEVLARVCGVDFSDVSLASHPLIMTLMIGVAVLVVPDGASGERAYRIWCDPSFGAYLGEGLAAVVVECGGVCTGVTV